jgi:hypothetical protein
VKIRALYKVFVEKYGFLGIKLKEIAVKVTNSRQASLAPIETASFFIFLKKDTVESGK